MALGFQKLGLRVHKEKRKEKKTKMKTVFIRASAWLENKGCLKIMEEA